MMIERVGIGVAPDKREEMRRGLASLVGPTSVEAGCIGCELFQEAGNPDKFSFEARWNSKHDLMKHLRSEPYKNLLILMELGSDPPMIEFHSVVETRGLDLIESVRRYS